MKPVEKNETHTIYVNYKDTPELREYRHELLGTEALDEDYELKELIASDMYEIWNEVGGQDGMYENFPISRVFEDENKCVRVYSLDGNGGVAIIANKTTKEIQILTLGEDDAYHFLNSRRIYCTYYGDKAKFTHLLKNAMTLFQKIEI